jgi:hypothetical protein
MLEFSSADWLIFRQMKKNLPKKEMVGGFVRCDSLLTYLNEISRINKVKNNDWLRNSYIEQVEIDMVHVCDLGTLGPAINYLFNDQSQTYSMSDRKKDYEIKEINGEYAFLANGESLTNRFIELSQKINQVDRYSYQVYDEITYKEKEVSPEHMSMIGNIMLSAHNLNNRGIVMVSDNFNAGKHESLNSGGGVSVSDTKLHLRNIIQNRKEVLKADKPQKIFEIKDYYAISQSFEDAYVVNVIAELISCLEDGVVNGDQFEEISKYFYPSLRDLKNKSFCGLVPIIYRAIHEEWMKNNSNY